MLDGFDNFQLCTEHVFLMECRVEDSFQVKSWLCLSATTNIAMMAPSGVYLGDPLMVKLVTAFLEKK